MKNKRIQDSFINAIDGVIRAIRTERNMKIHVVSAVCVLLLCLYYKITKTEFLIICLTITFVIVCELINTAVEALVDIIVDVYHPKAKMIKDVAAGAVFMSALMSLVVGYAIFFDRIMADVRSIIDWIAKR